MTSEPTIERVRVSAYTVPTDLPEADGTYEWSETTAIVVTAYGGGHTGLGYSYANAAAAAYAHSASRHVLGGSALSPRAAWYALLRAARNNGRQGLVSMAISAIDCALWDLKAHVLGVSFCDLPGRLRESIPVYGSGGFTSYTEEQLRRQLAGWAEDGIAAVKMKIGSHPECDLERVRAARDAIGDTALLVDANGAYTRKQALLKAEEFARLNVCWFEEPVSSDDLDGLRLIRDTAPAEMEIAAGEYGFDAAYFRRMMQAGAVDVIQVDATRCGGVTGFLQAAGEVDSIGLPLSAHTAPSLHGHLCCCVNRARNVEYFHDHVRIESMLFDGALTARAGALRPDPSAPGFGWSLKTKDAAGYLVYEAETPDRK